MTELSPATISSAADASIVFVEAPSPTEVIRLDAKGFHYRGQLIEDAGEAHRLMLEFLRKHQPKTEPPIRNGFEDFCVSWWVSNSHEETVSDAIEQGTMASFAEDVLAHWGN